MGLDRSIKTLHWAQNRNEMKQERDRGNGTLMSFLLFKIEDPDCEWHLLPLEEKGTVRYMDTNGRQQEVIPEAGRGRTADLEHLAAASPGQCWAHSSRGSQQGTQLRAQQSHQETTEGVELLDWSHCQPASLLCGTNGTHVLITPATQPPQDFTSAKPAAGKK